MVGGIAHVPPEGWPGRQGRGRFDERYPVWHYDDPVRRDRQEGRPMDKTRTKMDRLGLALGFLALSALSALAQVGTNLPFYPRPAATQSLSATTTSSSITFTGESLNDTELYVY